MSIILDKTLPLGQVRKIRDALEKEMAFYCDLSDPDDDRASWVSDMITWTRLGQLSYQCLRRSFLDAHCYGILKPLRQFRDACALAHEIESQAIANHLAIA